MTSRTRILTLASALLVAGGLALGAGGPARAASAYAGFGAGISTPTVDQGTVQFGTEDWSPSATAWRLFGGYVLTGSLGVEAGYVHLGASRVTTSGGDFFEAKTSGFELTPVAFLHVGAGLSALARAGLVFWHSDATYHYSVLGDGSKSKSSGSLIWSLGARYDLPGPLGVRAEYTRLAIDKTKGGAGDFNVIMFSAEVGF